MVNSKELRLGNLVRIGLEDEGGDLTPYLSHVAKVRSVDEYSIKIGIIDDMILISCNFGQGINPIKITKEVLECCKLDTFPYKVGWFCKLNSNFSLFAEHGDEFIVKYNKQRIIKLGCLHELQNIYKCIIGEELEIDIEKLKKIKNVGK